MIIHNSVYLGLSYYCMTIVEQIIIHIVEKYLNPFVTPVVIDKHAIRTFRKFVHSLDTNNSNLHQFKKAKRRIQHYQNDMSITPVVKSYIIQFLDILIGNQLKNDAKMSSLQYDNAYLKDQLQRERKATPPPKDIMLFADASRRLIDAMTFYCTVE